MTDIRTSLHWHLTANHFPPVPESMIEPCIEAINACNEEDYEREISLPDGITYKDGMTFAPASEFIENFHLDFYLNQEGEY